MRVSFSRRKGATGMMNRPSTVDVNMFAFKNDRDGEQKSV